MRTDIAYYLVDGREGPRRALATIAIVSPQGKGIIHIEDIGANVVPVDTELIEDSILDQEDAGILQLYTPQGWLQMTMLDASNMDDALTALDYEPPELKPDAINRHFYEAVQHAQVTV